MNSVNAGKYLKKKRTNEKIELSTMANDLGIDVLLLTRYEDGLEVISDDHGLKISKYLDFEPIKIGVAPEIPEKVPPKSLNRMIKRENPDDYKKDVKAFFDYFSHLPKRKSKKVKLALFEDQLFHPEKLSNEGPFMFFNLFMVFVIFFLFAYLIEDIAMTNFTLSLTVPFTMLWYLFERHNPRNVSGLTILKWFFFGGMASILIVLIIRYFVGYPDITFVQDLLTGLIEESAKILIVLILLYHKKIEHVMTGILIGFAVGAGFAVFETSLYGMAALLQTSNFDTMLALIFDRSQFALMGGIGHHFWTGMLAGALVAGSKTGYVSLKHLIRPAFLTCYTLVILLHALWNFLIAYPLVYYLVLIATITLFSMIWLKASNDYKEYQKKQEELNRSVEPLTEPKIESSIEVTQETPLENPSEATEEPSPIIEETPEKSST